VNSPLWEIEQTLREKTKKLIGVKLSSENATPTPLLNVGATWASYSVESIAKAIREA
jgi:hypothetical protein